MALGGKGCCTAADLTLGSSVVGYLVVVSTARAARCRSTAACCSRSYVWLHRRAGSMDVVVATPAKRQPSQRLASETLVAKPK